METPIIVQSDPKDYPFKKYIDECKHLDCDEHRHKIKSVIHIIDKDCRGQEHLFCDKSQRNAEGKFRRPKKIIEAEQRGFKSVAEMVDADKKAEEDKKRQEEEDMKKRSIIIEQHARDLEQQLAQSKADLERYMAITEERFNKLAKMISGK